MPILYNLSDSNDLKFHVGSEELIIRNPCFEVMAFYNKINLKRLT